MRHSNTLSERTKNTVTLYILIQTRTRFIMKLGPEAQRELGVTLPTEQTRGESRTAAVDYCEV